VNTNEQTSTGIPTRETNELLPGLRWWAARTSVAARRAAPSDYYDNCNYPVDCTETGSPLVRGRGSSDPPHGTASSSGRGSSDPPQCHVSRRAQQGSSLRRPVLGEESAQTYKQAGFGRPCCTRRSLVVGPGPAAVIVGSFRPGQESGT